MSCLVIVWDNSGRRKECEVKDMDEALAAAKALRVASNRTVKIAHAGNAVRHWSRTNGRSGNHWSARATADEFFA